MKVLFVMDRRNDAGSIQAVANYIRAGEELGHTLAVYGREEAGFPGVRFSLEAGAFDYAVFVFESKLRWMSGVQLAPVLSAIPRIRRAVLDADGMYNQRITLDDYDRNHASEQDRREWVAHCDRLAERILQPTLSPREARVRPLLFYGYDPDSRVRPAPEKQADIVLVAHNWWRWRELSERLLPAIEGIRSRLDGIRFVGAWWDGAPPWAGYLGLEQAFSVDPERLRRLRIHVADPVPYTEVIQTMSQGRLNIMTQRPLLRALGFVTSKYFEIFCADTVPLVMIPPEQAEMVYGPAGRELSLHEGMAEKLLDVLARPARYRELVEQVRRRLAERHSYRQRVIELAAALEA